MKKVCFIVDSIFSFGGVQRVTAVIAKELAKDYHITIATFDKPEDQDTRIYELDEADITYHFLSYPPADHLRKYIRKAYSACYRKLKPQSKWSSDLYAYSSFPAIRQQILIEEIREHSYDIVIGVHTPIAARLATIRHHFPQVRFIGWIHNSFEALFGKNSTYIGPELQRHYVYQFRKLDHTIVLCHHDAEMYEHYDPFFQPTVIYNPLTLEPGTPSEGKSKRFLAIGRFSHRHKGFDLLIEAFHRFAQQNRDWALDIVGEGEEQELYERMINQYQLKDRIIIHPFTHQIQSYYSQAQIYVLSSRWEGFGLVLVEAMAHGLPVISSDLPTSREIMGNTGIFFRNGDVGELAQRLEEATHIDWGKKSKEALETAIRFDISHIVLSWKNLIEQTP